MDGGHGRAVAAVIVGGKLAVAGKGVHPLSTQDVLLDLAGQESGLGVVLELGGGHGGSMSAIIMVALCQ